MNTPVQLTEAEINLESQRYMVKVYGWMSLALIFTALMAMFTASSEVLISFIFGNRLVFYGLIILEFVAVASLSGLINRISAFSATAIFIAYSLLNGLTLSCIFVVFTSESIASTFFITAGTFAIMSVYGYTTKSDLTKWGNILFMGLVGLILASIVNFFMQSSMLYWITTFVGVIIFVALTAYDTQKIKQRNIIGNEGTEEDSKEAIMGALTLYLDFINLFLYLLRLFGKRK